MWGAVTLQEADIDSRRVDREKEKASEDIRGRFVIAVRVILVVECHFGCVIAVHVIVVCVLVEGC